jgi:hypothetical protein
MLDVRAQDRNPISSLKDYSFSIYKELRWIAISIDVFSLRGSSEGSEPDSNLNIHLGYSARKYIIIA